MRQLHDARLHPGTRKSRNLAENPNCVISVALSGIDLIVEGTARIVTDEPTLRRLVELYAPRGWPVSVSDGAIAAEYSAPSAGRPAVEPLCDDAVDRVRYGYR